MKKNILIMLVAILGLSLTATSAVAGSYYRGWRGAVITVGGCAPVMEVHYSSITGPPPFFLPPPPPFFNRVLTGCKGTCRDGHYNFYHKHHQGHLKHQNSRDRGHHSNRYDNAKSHRPHRR